MTPNNYDGNAILTLNGDELAELFMKEWNCTPLEAYVAVELDCESLEETRKFIAQEVTYKRLLKSLLPGAIHYMRNDRYKDENVSEEFIQEEAKELVLEQSEMFVYDWQQFDGYDTISEAEIRAVI